VLLYPMVEKKPRHCLRKYRFAVPRRVFGVLPSAVIGAIPQFGYAWRRHGPAGLLKLAIHNIAYCARSRARAAVSPSLDEFDRKYGTQTDGIREIRTLEAASLPNARYAVRYGPSGEKGFRRSLLKLNIDPTRFTFIDFGSGKGRVLLIAAGFPFKAVLGIEFSQELHEIAVQNIARFPQNLITAGTLTSIREDASSFPLPPSDLYVISTIRSDLRSCRRSWRDWKRIAKLGTVCSSFISTLSIETSSNRPVSSPFSMKRRAPLF
jgi:hypothetical protein